MEKLRENPVNVLLMALIVSFTTTCSAPNSSHRTDPGTFLFSRPYQEKQEEAEKTDQSPSSESILSHSSCEDGKKMVRNGVRLIEKARKKFSDSLARISEYDHSYMLLLRSEEDQLRSAGKLRENGMKKLVNGLFVLYHQNRRQAQRTDFKKLDRLLRTERSVTDSVQDKKMGIFSDFEGIYRGLKKETQLLNQLNKAADRMLGKLKCE